MLKQLFLAAIYLPTSAPSSPASLKRVPVAGKARAMMLMAMTAFSLFYLGFETSASSYSTGEPSDSQVLKLEGDSISEGATASWMDFVIKTLG